MLKRSIKFGIRMAGRVVTTQPWLKKACLRLFAPFPALRLKLIYIIRNTKYPLVSVLHDYDDLPPRAREIYRQLTGRGKV